MKKKLFKLLRDVPGGHDDVLGGKVSLDNVYVRTYGRTVRGRAPDELDVDESCVREYALSGQKRTQYVLLRVQ
jgi:hypothetical protein